MSVSVDIVGYRNKAEGNKLIQDADALLKLRANLNQDNSKAINNYYERQKFNIPPVFKPTLSAEEELKDTGLQRQKALASLRTIMKEPDVLRTLDWLSTNNEINEFNRYSTLFLKEIAGQSNITPTYFETLWDRYKNKLIATGNTGISITTEPGEYKADIANIESLIISSGPTIAQRIEDMRNDAAILMGMDQKALDFEVNKQFFEDNKRNIDSIKKGGTFETIDIPLASGKRVDIYEIAPEKTTRELVLNKSTNKTKSWDSKNNEKVQYLLYKKYGIPIGMKLEWTGDPATVMVPASTIGISAPAGSAPAIRPSIMGAPSSTYKALLPARAPTGTSGTGFNHFAIYGAGLEVARPEPLAIDNHKPRRETLIPNQKNFGNYALSLNSLKKGFLCVRYPSGAQIPHFPKVMISSRFRKIINDIVYEDKFEEEDYMNLDEQEQKLFDDLITFCKMDKRDNVKIYKHKKYTDKDRDETIKRFNVIKGELLAGNDNPNVVKELKLLMMKMYNEKIISKAELNKIMYQLHLTV